MKYLTTILAFAISYIAIGQSKMTTPTKVVTINNSGNKIEPIKNSNKRTLKAVKVEIKKSEFKKLPKEKKKLILKEPNKYTIIED
jgi:hypothetical protein